MRSWNAFTHRLCSLDDEGVVEELPTRRSELGILDQTEADKIHEFRAWRHHGKMMHGIVFDDGPRYGADSHSGAVRRAERVDVKDKFVEQHTQAPHVTVGIVRRQTRWLQRRLDRLAIVINRVPHERSPSFIRDSLDGGSDDLRGHELGSPNTGARTLEGKVASETKVGEHDIPVLVDDYVLGLQVTVNDATTMEEMERFEEGGHNLLDEERNREYSGTTAFVKNIPKQVTALRRRRKRRGVVLGNRRARLGPSVNFCP